MHWPIRTSYVSTNLTTAQRARLSSVTPHAGLWLRRVAGALVLGLILFGPFAFGSPTDAAFTDQTASTGNTLATGYWIETVNSTGDLPDADPADGVCDTGQLNSALNAECTLRAAIQQANARPGDQVIEFLMPSSEPGHNNGVWTIAPAASLPDITEAVRIDGSSQPGFVPNTAAAPAGLNGTLVVEVQPTSAVRLFIVDANDVEIHGLAINSYGGMLIWGQDFNLTGSYVGTDVSGTIARPGGNNVLTANGARTRIGGTAPAERNLIAGHGSSLYLSNSGAIVEGNLFGTDVTASTPLGTQDENILVRGSNNMIGGVVEGAANIISGPGTGIAVDGGSRNSILGNVIVANTAATGLGIDLSPTLSPDGVTPNDPGDVDSGTNGYLNYPAITSTQDVGNTVRIDYELDVPAGNYRIEFFTNPSGIDPSGFGEGELLLGAATVTHAGAGVESFTASFDGDAGDFITATTTEDLGGGDYGSTSEFSAGAGNIVTVNSTGDLDDLVAGDARCDTGQINSEGKPECTLRAAMTEANASAMIDTVLFSIPSSDGGHSAGTWRIMLGSALPAITDAVTIDGTSQPGFVHNTNASPLALNWTQVIMIDGTNAGSGSAFRIVGNDVDLSGLTVGNFHWPGGYGIDLLGDRVRITEMAIGTDLAGQTRQPLAYGIWSTGNDITIGGTEPHERNLITGADNGQITFVPSTNAVVDGNLIGTNVDATTQLVPWGTGVEAWSGATIQIGTMAAGNVIAADWGIEGGADDLTIENNLIGTNATYDAPFGGWLGVWTDDRTVLRGNTIANWDLGVRVEGNSAVIEGNWIGTDPAGIHDFGMTDEGISVGRNTTDTTIGGTSTSQANVIANSGLNGIEIDATSSNTAVIGNSIYGNGGIGIDLDIDGITANDPGDTDVGANDRLNFPEITNALHSAGTVTIDYTLDVPAGQYRIEVFVNPSGADPLGHGEGESLVAATTISHAGMGTESFQVTYPGSAGDIVTMTATEELAGPAYRITSEFSASHLVAG